MSESSLALLLLHMPEVGYGARAKDTDTVHLQWVQCCWHCNKLTKEKLKEFQEDFCALPQWEKKLDVVQSPGDPPRCFLFRVFLTKLGRDPGAQPEGLHLPAGMWTPEGAGGRQCGKVHLDCSAWFITAMTITWICDLKSDGEVNTILAGWH